MNSLKLFLMRILGLKSVNGVMNAFHRTIAELEAVEQQHKAHAELQAQKMAEANELHQASLKEAAKAREVADKLADVVGLHAAEPTVA